tara:strand:- start:707 stop:895 length:189 start_codon:yes stop_codon:yes gene_type:complete
MPECNKELMAYLDCVNERSNLITKNFFCKKTFLLLNECVISKNNKPKKHSFMLKDIKQDILK